MWNPTEVRISSRINIRAFKLSSFSSSLKRLDYSEAARYRIASRESEWTPCASLIGAVPWAANRIKPCGTRQCADQRAKLDRIGCFCLCRPSFNPRLSRRMPPNPKIREARAKADPPNRLVACDGGGEVALGNDRSDHEGHTASTLFRSASPPPCVEGIEIASRVAGLTTDGSERSGWQNFWDTRRTPALLVSLIFHTSLLLLLALLTLTPPMGLPHAFDFQAVSQPQSLEDVNTQLLLATGDAPPPPAPTEAPNVEPPKVSTAAAISDLLHPLDVAPQPSPFASTMDQLLAATSSSLSASFVSTGVDGRQPEQRRQLALARGGTIQSEEAVERALDWLALHQLPSGAWSLVHDTGKCNGRCANNGVRDRFDPAATGLSLLAFLGAGYTHQQGKHQETVRKGVYFLLQILEETPQGGSFLYACDRGMYNHGIAAFAICEAYQLSGDRDLKRPAQQAIDFIVSSQNYRGGWGYLPQQPGDLTLSGWQIMALKSGSAAGLDVPPATILRIDPFLDSQQVESGVFYGYGKPGRSSTCTSIGLLIRLFRGMPHTDARILEGAQFLRKLGRSNGDIYFNYYATLFLFHVGEPFWREWNEQMREHLIATQATYGHETGSWYFENAYGKEGGRLYTTAMCAMTLEIYYRFSPIYQQADVPFEL